MWNNIAGSGSTSEDTRRLRLLNFGLANLFRQGSLVGTRLLSEFLGDRPLLFRGDGVQFDGLKFTDFFLHLLLPLFSYSRIV